MGSLKKHILYSDLDGTLIGHDNEISTRNIEALCRFTQAGGRFSVATGRGVDLARPFVRQLPVNAPAILFNGAAVYDYSREVFLHQVQLEPQLCGDLVKLSLEIYPEGCPEICGEGPLRLCNRSGVMDHYIGNENQDYIFAERQERYEGAFKMLVYGEHSRLTEVEEEFRRRYGESLFVLTYSADFYLEVLPFGATKGDALRWIEKNLDFPCEEIAAIGDFDNDIQMLQAASLGAAVQNASDRVKAAADLTVTDCDHAALEDLILHHLWIP